MPVEFISATHTTPTTEATAGGRRSGFVFPTLAAERGERHDRALWTPLVTATGADGSTTALVGSYETVAQAPLDYAGYVLPLVRQELARRPGTRVPARAGG